MMEAQKRSRRTAFSVQRLLAVLSSAQQFQHAAQMCIRDSVRTETSMLVIVIGARADDAVYKIAEKRAHKHEL